MNEILKKRCADLTVLDILTFANLKENTDKPYIDVTSFCDVSGIDRNKVHRLLINDLCGIRALVFGSYDAYKRNSKHKKMYFETAKVLEWLKNR